jgi:hypothetical protein
MWFLISYEVYFVTEEESHKIGGQRVMIVKAKDKNSPDITKNTIDNLTRRNSDPEVR